MLCRRGPTGFELTDDGNILAETCQRFAETLREIPTDFRTSRQRSAGISDHVGQQPGQPALDAAIGSFHAKYPRVEIIVEVAAWTEVVNWLIQHKVDIGISPSRVKRAELEMDHLFKEVHRPYCGRAHRLFGLPGRAC